MRPDAFDERFVFGRLVAVFYAGLGASLLLAGILFGRSYGRARLASA